MIALPRLIAIVGHPGSGKSLVQQILQEDWNVTPVDDGYPLRQFAMEHIGLSHDDCYTQEGKRRRTFVVDRQWENRKVLGEIGAKLEELFGEHFLPWAAERNLPHDGRSFSFGSVRRSQPWFYKNRGGVVIEVRNPLARPTGNIWDEFDPGATDLVIDNNALMKGLSHAAALRDLRDKVHAAVLLLSSERKTA